MIELPFCLALLHALPAASAQDLVLPVALDAVAADDEDNYDVTDEETDSRKRTKGAGQVREIVRGFYAKSNIGAATYLGSFSDAVSTGIFVSLAVGQDFVDNEKQSMAWEVALQQGLHNGLSWYEQASYGCQYAGGPSPCTQGDLRTYTLAANYEISFYPTRRIGIGARAGAGVLYSPLLIEASAWQNEVIQEYGGDPGFHNSPKPVFFGGPTFEYYTKLSHFSVGVDVDVMYGLGWDLGLNASGNFKYTF